MIDFSSDEPLIQYTAPKPNSKNELMPNKVINYAPSILKNDPKL
jgi:hypothetical protein